MSRDGKPRMLSRLRAMSPQRHAAPALRRSAPTAPPVPRHRISERITGQALAQAVAAETGRPDRR